MSRRRRSLANERDHLGDQQRERRGDDAIDQIHVDALRG
jgi:hypothetical protein